MLLSNSSSSTRLSNVLKKSNVYIMFSNFLMKTSLNAKVTLFQECMIHLWKKEGKSISLSKTKTKKDKDIRRKKVTSL